MVNRSTSVANRNSRSMIEDWINEVFNTSTFPRVTQPISTPLRGTDVYRDDDALVYETELPGMAREDLTVRLEGHHLIVSGNVKRNESIDEESYLSMGRSYGQFQRAFRLPQDFVETDGKKIDAKLVNGILTIRIPFKENVKPQTIDIKVG